MRACLSQVRLAMAMASSKRHARNARCCNQPMPRAARTGRQTGSRVFLDGPPARACPASTNRLIHDMGMPGVNELGSSMNWEGGEMRACRERIPLKRSVHRSIPPPLLHYPAVQATKRCRQPERASANTTDRIQAAPSTKAEFFRTSLEREFSADRGGPHSLDKKQPFLSYTLPGLPNVGTSMLLSPRNTFWYRQTRRVKRRLALLASIQPRDNSAEGVPPGTWLRGSNHARGVFSCALPVVT
jgi:hypothetical protein